jgi:TRAP-type C4-dicarboxylate transport system substrate-binding protein
MEALGADVIYLPSPDVVPALQTGLIEAGLTPTIAYAQTGLTSEAPHFSMIEYTQIGNLLVASKTWLDALPPAEADLVTATFASNAEIRRALRALAADGIARQKEFGFTAHALTAEQRAHWRQATSSVVDALIAQIGGQSRQFYDAIEAGRRAFAAAR